MKPAIELRDVSVEYETGVKALDGVDLRVEDGEIVTVVGPSGCGKSSLLRVIAGLVRATSGEVRLDGARVNELDPGRRDVALVFQSYALYPHMTVRQNLEFPLRMRKVPRTERRRRAVEVAEKLELGALLDRRPHEISGGQMQRVAIGRALVREPRAFLLDEPLSNLDPRLAEDVRGELRRLFRDSRATVLYVTHDQVGALTLGDRLCVLGEGRVAALGRPLDLLAAPPSTLVADLLGSPPLNLVPGRVAGGRFIAGSLALPAPYRPDGEVVLGLAPGALELRARGASGTLDATVVDVERTGARTLLRVTVGGNVALRVSLEGNVPCERGSVHGLEVATADLHWFDAATGLRT